MADAVIPRFRAERTAVPGTYDPERRPGSSGQRYFSDMVYANPNMGQRVFDPEAAGYETQADYDARFDRSMDSAIDAARDTNRAQVTGLQALNLSNPAMQQRPAALAPVQTPAAGIATVTPNQTSGVDRIYDLLQRLTQGTQQQPYGVDTAGDMGADTTGQTTNGTTTESASYTFPAEIERGVGMMGVGNAVEQIGYRNPKDYFEMGLTPEDIVSRGLGGFTSEQPGSRPYDLLVGEYKNYLDVQEAHRLGGEKSLAAARAMGQYGYAQGGLASMAPKGMYLGGSTDGMADRIPATIDGTQPAALSDGEFVIPADVVSHLGNGNSDSGAQQLYGMMDRVRKARTGTKEQGRQINPQKFLA